MGVINVLDKHTANLIAAGEVVERPASAIKEMLENCADAGAKCVTVEIKDGGTSFIRITDDGCGMAREDVPKSILRHATSKIREPGDLEAIATLGFRGEALAAIAAVSTVRILTKRAEDSVGTTFMCKYGEVLNTDDTGCPDGTTIIVENIFENTPARRKFLKKNSTEATAVFAVCEKFALSRPNIAVKLISDGSVKLDTPGDGKLKNAIYAAIGREFANALLPVDSEFASVHAYGYIGKPETCRPNRNMQNFFVNGRYIKSRTMMAALEEGFRGFCPAGKFPACVLFVKLDLNLVDVNIHPAKLEIKFSDERKVFDTIYFAVKNALSRGISQVYNFGPEENILDFCAPSVKASDVSKDLNKTAISHEKPISSPPSSQLQLKSKEIPAEKFSAENILENIIFDSSSQYITGVGHTPIPDDAPVPDVGAPYDLNTAPQEPKENLTTVSDKPQNEEIDSNSPSRIDDSHEKNPNISQEPNIDSSPTAPAIISNQEPDDSGINNKNIAFPTHVTDTAPLQRQTVYSQVELFNPGKLLKSVYIGEVFDTYIIVSRGENMYLIDKHAAHERIIYERIKHASENNDSQYLLEPVSVTLVPKEFDAVASNSEYFSAIGFEFEEFGDDTYLVRSKPSCIENSAVKDVFTFLAGKIAEGNSKSAGEIFDRALYTAACKAAIKAGNKFTEIDNKRICDEIFENDAVLYCPHGRPVLVEFSKQKIEKMFGRL